MRPSSAKSRYSSRLLDQNSKSCLQKQQKIKTTLQPKVRTLESSVLQNKRNSRPQSSYIRSDRSTHQLNPEVPVMLKDEKLKHKALTQYQAQKKVRTEESYPVECALERKVQRGDDKLLVSNIKYHDPYLCVCHNCTCGNHICKIHPQNKPSIHSSSTYQKQFNKKNPFDSINFQPTGAFKNNSPGVDPQSTYHKDYSPKVSQPNSKFQPIPCLKLGGPSNSMTSYSQSYPGYQPTFTQSFKQKGGQVIEGVKLNPKTTYSKQFRHKQPQKVTQYKKQDNLKSGNVWMCGSTYKDTFKKPIQTYSAAPKSKVSNIEEPKYANQFNTTYNDEYVDLDFQICPAKVELQTRHKFFNTSKLQALRNQRKTAELSFKAST